MAGSAMWCGIIALLLCLDEGLSLARGAAPIALGWLAPETTSS